jgi:hypothetical protein
MEHRAVAAAGRALKLALTEETFKAHDVRREFANPPSEATVTRVLRQLESDDWLERDQPRSSIWRAGFLARTLGDLDDSAGQEHRRGFDLDAEELLDE